MNITTFKGKEIKLSDNFIQIGNRAPEFELTKRDLTTFRLEDVKGKYVILNIFPSLDTGVCANSVRKFNEIASELPNVTILAISKDLPFAQERFCTLEGIKNIIALADFKNSDFGKKYGVLMEDGPLSGLLARAVVVINPVGEVIYAELVPEITLEPDYDAVINVLNKQ